ncbi:oxidoreductase [Stigmatella sp. ncwal1]|uniref:Oxidoreductase n=1 Tax=Stigmatella ashevillensis TaxID=2995309 RepID=A0ABT5DNY7_9BACT|nr:oxidoreductase [Stigmatella ashevillena]MDC0714875.1 oxidoreductase [Stigmatella ashevillena]
MRTWFITGASRGFGALITAEALAAGDAVVATARDPLSVVAKFGEHPRLLAVKLDVTREEQAQAAVEAAIQRFGRIDILINNAGYGLLGAVEEARASEVERVFATNVFGLLSVTRAVLPHMRRQRSGHVINISSIGGYGSYAGWGVYCATKFAVEGLTEAMAAELAPLGIHATVVEPGFFRTDFLDAQSLVTAEPIADYAATSGATRTGATQLNHAQPGNPEKLAKALLALVGAARPPLRLPLGSDTVARIEAKNRSVAEELATWRELAVSTDGFSAV